MYKNSFVISRFFGRNVLSYPIFRDETIALFRFFCTNRHLYRFLNGETGLPFRGFFGRKDFFLRFSIETLCLIDFSDEQLCSLHVQNLISYRFLDKRFCPFALFLQTDCPIIGFRAKRFLLYRFFYARTEFLLGFFNRAYNKYGRNYPPMLFFDKINLGCIGGTHRSGSVRTPYI